MELQQYVQVLREYWRSIVATILVTICLVAGYTILQTPQYSTKATIFVSVESGETAGELSQGATYAERQVQSFVEVASTSIVLQPVIDELQLDTTPASLASRISVSSPGTTSLIDISVSGADPDEITTIANTTAGSLVTTVDELSPQRSDGRGLVSAAIINPAVVPSSPTSPNATTNLVLAVVLGILLGYGQALLRSILDTRVRNVDDIQEITEVPVLAAVAHQDPKASKESQHAHAEAYRRLRTNISFIGLGGERRPSLVVTSSLRGEGKTQTAVNLAKVLAQAGDNVLLIDADLRRPQVAARLKLDSELGLSDVLSRRGNLSDLTILADDNLWVLPAGTVPPNPSELLGSLSMEKLLQVAEREFDHVIIDSPPVLPVTDATILASKAGGAVLVARADMVRKNQLESALEQLSTGQAEVAGIVVNDLNVTKRTDQYGYYSEYTKGIAVRPEGTAKAKDKSMAKHQA